MVGGRAYAQSRIPPGGRVSGSDPLLIAPFYGLWQIDAREYEQREQPSCDSAPLYGGEDYLIADYRGELAEPDVQYIKMVNAELRQVIMGEVFQRWYGSADPDIRLR